MDETITLTSPIKSHPGEVVIPGRFTGANELAYYQAGRRTDVHTWQGRWQWARDTVVEWRIEGLPTNLPEIKKKEGDFPFALVSWLPKAIRQALDEYVGRRMEEYGRQLDIPALDTLTAGEFFTWYTRMEEAKKANDKSKPESLLYWPAAISFVRGWGNIPLEERQDETGEGVDLALILAVMEKTNPLVQGAVDLGNSPAPPGAPSTKKKG